MFRAANAEGTEEDDEDLLSKPELARDAAAQAAIKRFGSQHQKTTSVAVKDESGQEQEQEPNGISADDDKKPAAVESSATPETAESTTKDKSEDRGDSRNGEDGMEQDKNEQSTKDESGESSSNSEDINLALEMMENAFSILDEHSSSSSSVDKKAKDRPSEKWISTQMPRVLQGLGDVLTAMHRLADASDVYSRALPYREAAVQQFQKEQLDTDHLRVRRQLVEANILVAEALLACPDGQDVVTTETSDVLVVAPERVDYARGYYDKARDELQEAVLLMGKIAGAGKYLGMEKEDVCFAATLLMGVGETLASYDEKQSAGGKEQDETDNGKKGPATKKAKR